MNDPAQAPQLVYWLVPIAALVGSVLVWLIMFGWRRQGRPAFPLQRRRPVPWGGIDVMAVFAAHLVFLSLFADLAVRVLAINELAATNRTGDTLEHSITQLVRDGGACGVLLAAISVVIVAPIVEELMFRVLLQGWLEGVERRSRRPATGLRPRLFVLGATGPVLLSALAFASVHLRGPAKGISLENLLAAVLANNLASLATLAFAVLLLHFRAGTTARDVGWVRGRLLADVGLGVLGFLAVAGPVFLVHFAAVALFQRWGIQYSPDPLALFPFALALGTIYFRTHRIVPVIVAHASLNAVTLATLWVMICWGVQP
jgi:membrane protease YdiL (CAAX protease family)